MPKQSKEKTTLESAIDSVQRYKRQAAKEGDRELMIALGRNAARLLELEAARLGQMSMDEDKGEGEGPDGMRHG